MSRKKREAKRKKEQTRRKNKNLALKVTLLILTTVIMIFLIFSLMTSMPYYKEPITNMTFKEYSSVLYNYEIMMYPSRAEVTPIDTEQERLGIGVVTDQWNLYFGSIPGGSSYARYVSLTNIGGKEAKVIFKAYGNITSFIEFDNNNFILYPNESVTVKVTFKSTPSEPGNFTGRIDRIVKIPKYDFLYIFW